MRAKTLAYIHTFEITCWQTPKTIFYNSFIQAVKNKRFSNGFSFQLCPSEIRLHIILHIIIWINYLNHISTVESALGILR